MELIKSLVLRTSSGQTDRDLEGYPVWSQEQLSRFHRTDAFHLWTGQFSWPVLTNSKCPYSRLNFKATVGSRVFCFPSQNNIYHETMAENIALTCASCRSYTYIFHFDSFN